MRTFATVLNAKDLAEDNLCFVARHYDLVLLAFPFPEVVTRLRAGNPDLIVLLFNNPYFPFGDVFWQAPKDKSPETIAGNWLLRDASGALIRYNGPLYGGLDFEQRQPLMDIRVAAWQKYYAAQSRKYVDAAGLDGLFIDTLGEHLPPFAVGPSGARPTGFSANGWREAAHALLGEVEAALAGTDALIVFNGISRPVGLPQQDLNRNLLRRCDGTAVEAFGIAMGIDHNDEAKRWFFFETILKDVASAASNDKLVLLEVYGHDDSPAHRYYALCAFLLIQNERTYFCYTSMSRAGSTRWRPEWSLDLGQATGTYRQRDGVYVRRFTKATVWVNPLPKTKSLALPLAQIDPAGNLVEQLSLPAFSGTILFDPNVKEHD